MADLRFEKDDLSRAAVQKLIGYHLSGMDENSPPGTSYALDLDALKTPNISFFSGWLGPDLAVIGAIKQLAYQWGELKSMRVHPDFSGAGAGRAMLQYLIGEAKRRGYKRLSLETGTTPAFHPGIALYARNGFVLGERYADYRETPFNIFMHLDV